VGEAIGRSFGGVVGGFIGGLLEFSLIKEKHYEEIL
jgi:hypothetical protein